MLEERSEKGNNKKLFSKQIHINVIKLGKIGGAFSAS